MRYILYIAACVKGLILEGGNVVLVHNCMRPFYYKEKYLCWMVHD